MKLHKSKLQKILTILFFSFSFFGFYTLLLVSLHSGMYGSTRLFTIPFRMILVFSAIGIIILNYKNYKILLATKFFIVFSALFVLRVMVDSLLGNDYYLPLFENLLYFMSFVFIPFLTFVSYRLNKYNAKTIVYSIFYSGFVFSIITIYNYRIFVGQVGRLNSSSAGEDVLSPLALSYSSALVIAISIIILANYKPSFINKTIAIISILFSIVLFFLGSSRGSLIAFMLPFLILLFARLSVKNIIKTILFSFILLFLVLYLNNILGSSFVDRFTGISEITEKDEQGIRILIWKSSFNQFLNHPLFGDKLRVDGWKNYPHNLFLEVLQTVGLIGFIPFIILILKGFRISYRIFTSHQDFFWIPVIYIQAFAAALFSGTIFMASWLWISLALLLSFESNLKRKLINNNY